MAVKTGQRTTEDKPKPEPAKPAPAKATPKPAAKKTAEKAPAKNTATSSINIELAANPFYEDEKVGVYYTHEVSVEANEGRKPIPEPLGTLNIGDDGTAKVSKKLKPGGYTAYGEDSGRYLGITVK